MAPQKQQELGLAPPAPRGHIVSAGPSGGSTRGERQVIEEYLKQAAVIDGQAAKAVQAIRALDQLATYTTNLGARTILEIEETQAQTQSPAVRAFCERAKQLYGYQALDILQTSGDTLHREVNRSLYPTEPPRRRWFGG